MDHDLPCLPLYKSNIPIHLHKGGANEVDGLSEAHM